jgi:hypothetical protein
MDRAGQPFFPQGQGDSVVGARGRAPAQPAASCGSGSKPPRRGQTRPMLFAQKLLAPGPQPKHPGNVKLFNSHPGIAGGLPNGNYKHNYNCQIFITLCRTIPHYLQMI